MGAKAPTQQAKHQQLLIVQKYEVFIDYFYPVAQNIPRQHGVAKALFIEAMLNQVSLFIDAGKTNQQTRLYLADAGLANLRYWLRFWSDGKRRVITDQQHRVGSTHLAEVGAILGSWIKSKGAASG